MVPEDMEHLVRPLNWQPNQESTTKTLKITFSERVFEGHITEQDVLTFLEPHVPVGVALFVPDPFDRQVEAYAHFETNELCQEARRHDGELFAGVNATVRYSVDSKWNRVVLINQRAAEFAKNATKGEGEPLDWIDAALAAAENAESVPGPFSPVPTEDQVVAVET